MSESNADLRKELLAARERVTGAISNLEYPMRGPFVYHEGIDRLRATLAEINDALARLDIPSA